MKRTLCLMLVLWLAAPSTAQAHLMNTGLGPFYDGLAHLFASPDDLLPVIALALLAGLRGPQSGRAVLFVLPVAWLMGSFAGLWMTVPASLSAVTAAATFVLGAHRGRHQSARGVRRRLRGYTRLASRRAKWSRIR